MKRLLNTLYITTQGTWLSLEGETIVVSVEREIKQKLPIHNIGGIICFGQVGASPPLLGFCASRGVAVSFMTEYGRFLARMDGPVRGNVLLRRQQYRLADNQEESSKIARSALIGKVTNSRLVLQRAAREGEDVSSSSLNDAIKYLAITLKDFD
jgi:CRISPR-associated protein Cas1